MSLTRSASEDPTPHSIRPAIVNGLWQRNESPVSPLESQKWDAYFHYYTAECKKAIGYGRGEYTTIRCHEDIIRIAEKLENGITRAELKTSLIALCSHQRPSDVKDQMAEGSVRLAARLISMVDIGPILYGIQGRAPISWADERSNLKTLLVENFKESSAAPERIRFEEEFTALNLRRFAGLEIQLTNNLADHLRLIENDTKLCIFHHVTFLRWNNSAIFPEGLAKETLKTLALLFPRYDRDTEKALDPEWSSSESTVYLDLDLLNCDRIMPEDRRADTFKFWRDELIILKGKFDKPRHSSIVNLWYDRRNKVQWYTFWIAVFILCLTVFFGLIQSIEGALQVYKAYHPTSL